MSIVHFLNVLEGDCTIIQHDGPNKRVTVIDVSNASNDEETPAERAVSTSQQRQIMLERTKVPATKRDYRQKLQPDNPITYLKRIGVSDVFRFIVTHPDMDHLDGIRDFFQVFRPNCFWDTDNNKEIAPGEFGGGYNKEDWEFYLRMRNGNYRPDTRRAFYSGNSWDFFVQDHITILAPTYDLVRRGNETKDYNDCSYVLLYTPPKKNGQTWKILFCGDSHDDTWDYILRKHKAEVANVDILMAPHHGRDSNRDYAFLDVVKPKLTLFGNASSEHLAYSRYPEIRITNNQAGFIVLDISPDHISVFVKNKEFADDFRNNPKRNLGNATYNATHKAYYIGSLT